MHGPINIKYLEHTISVKNIYLLQSNYAYSDMFRLEGFRPFVEPYRRYIQYTQNVHCTWYIYDRVQQIAWWWPLRDETCRYMHNLTIINRYVWLKLNILSNIPLLPITLSWCEQGQIYTYLFFMKSLPRKNCMSHIDQCMKRRNRK